MPFLVQLSMLGHADARYLCPIGGPSIGRKPWRCTSLLIDQNVVLDEQTPNLGHSIQRI